MIAKNRDGRLSEDCHANRSGDHAAINEIVMSWKVQERMKSEDYDGQLHLLSQIAGAPSRLGDKAMHCFRKLAEQLPKTTGLTR